AAPRALVYAGLVTSGDARSSHMISGDAKSWVCLHIFTVILHNCPAVEILAQRLGLEVVLMIRVIVGLMVKGGQVGDQGSEVNDGVHGVPDFSTIIAQQLQNLLPTIVAQVGDQDNHKSGCSESKGNSTLLFHIVGKALTWWNSQIHTRGREAANHAMVEAGHAAYTDRFHELARLVPHLVTPKGKRIKRYLYGLALQIRGMVAATEPKTIQKAVQIAGTLTDEALRNGSIKKNPEKRGNRENLASIGNTNLTLSNLQGNSQFLVLLDLKLRAIKLKEKVVPKFWIWLFLVGGGWFGFGCGFGVDSWIWFGSLDSLGLVVVGFGCVGFGVIGLSWFGFVIGGFGWIGGGFGYWFGLVGFCWNIIVGSGGIGLGFGIILDVDWILVGFGLLVDFGWWTFWILDLVLDCVV
ncbi:hypothetical protein Tco_0979607, partial [Tanacetum coccineum]